MKLYSLLVFFIFFYSKANALSLSCSELFKPSYDFSVPGLDEPTSRDYHRYVRYKNLDDVIIVPSKGYLEGFEIFIPNHIRAKLEIKHQIPLQDVEAAFNHWTVGAVRETSVQERSDLRDNIRYYFVSRIPPQTKHGVGRNETPEKFIKVVFDLTTNENIILVSAFFAPASKYRRFQTTDKELN